MSLVYESGKGEEVGDRLGRLRVLEFVVQTIGEAEFGPSTPISALVRRSRRHDAIGRGCSRSSEKISVQILGWSWTSCQVAVCERGKRRLNNVRKCVWVSRDGSLKDCEATSAIVLSF